MPSITGKSGPPQTPTDSTQASDQYGAIIDLTNQTTLDDCLAIMNRTRLAVGGSSGLLHLASRCGVNRVIWGDPRTIVRYAETNWFGSRFEYMSVGWAPQWEDVAAKAEEMLK